MERRSVRTFRPSKPGSTSRRLPRLRIISPDPASNTSASATSATTSTRRLAPPRRPLPAPGLPSFRSAVRPARVAPNAGASPNSSPTATVTRNVNPSALASSRMASKPTAPIPPSSPCTRNVSRGLIALRTRVPASATARLAAPPRMASTRLSVTRSLTSRPRPAPSASRTAISCRRAIARARSRLARFTQAISRTMATAPNNTSSERLRPEATRIELSGRAAAVHCCGVLLVVSVPLCIGNAS